MLGGCDQEQGVIKSALITNLRPKAGSVGCDERRGGGARGS